MKRSLVRMKIISCPSPQALFGSASCPLLPTPQNQSHLHPHQAPGGETPLPQTHVLRWSGNAHHTAHPAAAATAQTRAGHQDMPRRNGAAQSGLGLVASLLITLLRYFSSSLITVAEFLLDSFGHVCFMTPQCSGQDPSYSR